MNYLFRFSVSLVLWLAFCSIGVLSTMSVAKAEIVSLSACTSIYPPQYLNGTLGKHVAFVCSNSTGTTTYQDGVSCLHSSCNISAFTAAVTRVVVAPDYKAALDLEWASIKWDCNNPPGPNEKALCDERMGWIRANWPVWTKDFKPAVWKVKANGTATTRPAYALVNGVLGTEIVGRAPVGATCRLDRPTAPATGGDIRAEFEMPGVVTICKKQ